MADIVMTATQVAVIFPAKADIHDYIATETITKGQAVYILTTGKIGVADANAAGKQQFRGIALSGGGAGQGVSVLHRGHVFGYTVSGLNANVLAYLSDTAGALGDGVGTMTVPVGRIVSLSDNSLTKVLFIDVQWTTTWA